MVDLDKLMNLMEETKNGCDHNCETCEMFLPTRNECYHIAEQKWRAWNEREHDRFGQLLKGER